MRKRTTAIAVAGTLALTAVALKAVTFGEPDGNRHPYVGTLLFETPSGLYSCSGTLLAPTVVLTAGHCTEEGGVSNLDTWVKFTPTITFPGIGGYPTVEDYLNDPANGWVHGTAIPHPLYDDFSRFPATYDIGVVILDTPVAMSTYGELPDENFLRTIRTAAENRFTVVGYGMQGLVPPFYQDVWERYQGKVHLLELKSALNAGMSAKFSNNPGIGGGSCFGDSGGPIFYDNTNIVVAVVSWGRTPCIGVDYQFRTDTALALDFVRSYVP